MVLCLFLLTAPEAWSEKKENDETGAEAKPEVRGYITIQLLSLSIPTMTKEGWIGRGPMTIFPVVRGQGNVEKFCKFLPRVREAITISVDQNPIPVVGDKYVFQDIGAKLQGAINKALPKPIVIRLHMFPMSRHMGQNAEVMELPGTTSECMALKEMPRDLEAMLRGKNAEAKSFSVAEPKTPPGLKPAPKKVKPPKPAPAPRGKGAKPAIVVNKVNRPPPDEKVAAVKECRPVEKVWPEGFHKALGAVFWLDKAFSLDEDNDGAVDNVGFILKSDDKPNMFVYYFPGPGRQSVISVPTLRLGDDRDVSKTCFGKVSYEKLKPKKKKPLLGFKVPDLAGEMAAKSEKNEQGETLPAVSKGEPNAPSGLGLVFLVVIGAGAILIIGGGLGYVVARKKSERRRKDRRRGKEKRRGERRKTDAPPEGADLRKGKDRRGKDRRGKDRRSDERRRDKDRRE